LRIGPRLLLRLIAAEFSYFAQSSDMERQQQVLFLQELSGLQRTSSPPFKEFANSNNQ
jgi:hypothetical protein